MWNRRMRGGRILYPMIVGTFRRNVPAVTGCVVRLRSRTAQGCHAGLLRDRDAALTRLYQSHIVPSVRRATGSCFGE